MGGLPRLSYLVAATRHEVVEDVPVFPKDELVRAYLLTVACGTARFVAVTMTSSISWGAACAEPAANVVIMAALAEITAALNLPRRNIQNPH